MLELLVTPRSQLHQYNKHLIRIHSQGGAVYSTLDKINCFVNKLLREVTKIALSSYQNA